MNHPFQRDFPIDDLLILAGLLGYRTVFGLPEPLAAEWCDPSHHRIKAAVNRLERRKLIRYELDGTLYVNDALRTCMACLCDADTVAVFSSNIHKGKTATVYLLKRGNALAQLEQIGNGHVRLQPADETAVSSLFSKAAAAARTIDETLSIKDAAFVQEQWHSFNESGAHAHLATCMNDEAAAPILATILSGTVPYLQIRIHQRTAAMFTTAFHALMTVSAHQTVCVSADSADGIRFSSTDPAHLRERVNRFLEI